MKHTPRLQPYRANSVPQVGWLVAEGNYTHLYFHDGSYYFSSVTLGKVSKRYPYLLRLNKQLAVDPTLIVSWYTPARNQLRVSVRGWDNGQSIAISRRRINDVKAILIQVIAKERLEKNSGATSGQHTDW